MMTDPGRRSHTLMRLYSALIALTFMFQISCIFELYPPLWKSLMYALATLVGVAHLWFVWSPEVHRRFSWGFLLSGIAWLLTGIAGLLAVFVAGLRSYHPGVFLVLMVELFILVAVLVTSDPDGWPYVKAEPGKLAYWKWVLFAVYLWGAVGTAFIVLGRIGQ